MKFDNFNAVDNGFSNITGGIVSAATNSNVGTTMISSTPPILGGITATAGMTTSQSTAPYVFRNISHLIDVYTLIEPSGMIQANYDPIFNGVNIMGLRNKYLFVGAQAYVPNPSIPTTTIQTPQYQVGNSLNVLKNYFKSIRPFALAYAQNPTTTNLNTLTSRINTANSQMASSGLRIFSQIAGF